MAKKVWTGAMIIILLGSLIFSLSQVGKINRHTYWTQTANFIESDYPNATVIITQHDYWFLAELRDSTYLTPHYLDTNFVIPDKDQLVITTYTKDAYATQDHSPLDNDLTFFKRSKNTTSEAFITYLENNGHIVFTGHNGPNPAVVVYKITKTPKNSPGILKTAPPPESKSFILKAMWTVLCTAHEGNPLVVESIFPDNLAESVKNKCN